MIKLNNAIWGIHFIEGKIFAIKKDDTMDIRFFTKRIIPFEISLDHKPKPVI